MDRLLDSRVVRIESSINKIHNFLKVYREKAGSPVSANRGKPVSGITSPSLPDSAVVQTLLVLTADAEIADISAGTAELLGRPVSELSGKAFRELVVSHQKTHFDTTWRSMRRGRTAQPAREIHVNVNHSDASEIPLHLVALDDTGGSNTTFRVTDTSGRFNATREAWRFRQSFQILAETVTEGIIQIQHDFVVSFANPAVSTIFGLDAQRVIGNSVTVLFPSSRGAEYVAQIERYFFIDNAHRKRTGMKNSLELIGKRAGGDLFPLEISLGNSRGVRDQRVLTCILRDITERKKAERRLRFLAYHDQLTSLGNRDMLDISLNRLLAELKRQPERRAAILYLDLDGFKKVNDSLGHEMGDAILKEAARRLHSCLRAEDQIYRVQIEDIFRLGGDEFTVLLPHIARPEDAGVVAARIVDQILRPFEIPDLGPIRDVSMGVSVGIAIMPDDGMDKTTLLRNADAAMYQAKEFGNRYVFFRAEMNSRAMNRLLIEDGLRKALRNDELKLYYQPIVDAAGTVIALESLVRWHHPERGVILPDQFIPIAEDSRLMHQLGRWVLETACIQLGRFHNLGWHNLLMTINISPRQMERDDLHELVHDTCRKTGISAGSLVLEITETTLMSEPEATIRKIGLLQEYNPGLKMAIDDFGTGYSSLSYLSRFPVNILKIDKSFTTRMEKDNNSKIIDTILLLGASLGVLVIAEGVEQERHHSILKQKGCQNFQGFHFSAPRPFKSILEYLKQSLPKQ